MDFADRLQELSDRIPQQVQHIRTEEATKNALVMPFITALGYNVFDPTEVTPELCADVGVKKGEKVDYAILMASEPIMLFECKDCSADLDSVHASQLYRYFSVTEARIGVLTNGIIYRFYSDLDAPNKMDARPFLEVNMLALDDFTVNELKKFTKSTFKLDSVLANASDLKYTREVKRIIAQQMNEPSADFVRFFASQVYEGKTITQAVRDKFAEITKKALQQIISERVSDRLKSALEREEAAVMVPATTEPAPEVEASDIVTTEDELRAFYIIQAILTQVVDPRRVVMRDQKTYCAILLDDNNRKPLCRLRFGATQMNIGLFDAAKAETRQPLTELADIYHYAKHLTETASRYADGMSATGAG